LLEWFRPCFTARTFTTFIVLVTGRARFEQMCESAGVEGGTILHADLDAFYASVEQRDDPRLRGRPVIVGAGVVLAASYEAKACGVRTAMGGWQARRLCPRAIVVPPRFSAYSAASKAVFEVFRQTTPLVEGLSIDEAFLEVGGLRKISGTPAEIARRLRAEVRERVGLPITVGVARTKFLAKVASRVAKPDGVLVVPPDGELEFLHPLPVEMLWGVGAVTGAKLRERGIRTVGVLARLGEPALVSMLGVAMGRHLHALAHNKDPRVAQVPSPGRDASRESAPALRVGRRRGSIGSQRALGRRPKTPEEIDAYLAGLVDRVTRRMRAAQRLGRTVTLRMRFDDFSRATRSRTMLRPTAHTETILAAARGLLATAQPMIRRRGLTLIGISVGNLEDSRYVQLELPFDPHDSFELDTALDAVRDRYGSAAVTRAALLNRGQGMTVPMLPD
jgi:DNA polymerase-4